MSRHKGFAAVLAAIVLATACVSAQAQSVVYAQYDAQMGGWDYAYTGDVAAPDTGSYDALDGTGWTATDPSSSWDGSAPGVVGSAPGGIGAFADGGTNYMRFQDSGNPGDWGLAAPNNANMYLGKEINNDTQLLDNGVTISFRARVPMEAAAGQPLDDWYPDDHSTYYVPGVPQSWPPLADVDRYGGAGKLITSGGKGSFGIWQKYGLNDAGYQYGKVVSFSLSVGDATHFNSYRGTTVPDPVGNGLVMNSQQTGPLANIPNDSVDVDQHEGIINILPITETDATPDDLSQWHEFWITIEASGRTDSTHRVDVWVDGAIVPQVYYVTAGDSGQEPDFASSLFGGATADYDNAMLLGAVGSRQPGAFDVDFFAVKSGVYSIPYTPEPSTLVLLGIAAFCGLVIRKMHRR